jgi:NitT/TauT family transport system permease protein
MLAVDRDAAPSDQASTIGVLDDSATVSPPEARRAPRPDRGRQLWLATWPKVAAIALAVLVWQIVVWTGWRKEYVLPSPPTVFKELGSLIADGSVFEAIGTTMRRAAVGYSLALVIGALIGAVVVSSKIARSAVGSLITGLQTMPSIAWFPLAILLFKLTEGAITFVVVLGAAPSIANGLITGVDHVPPILVKAGRTIGARRTGLLRHVVLPAAMPNFVGGLKQGWAFAWRSLLAGELLVTFGVVSIGSQLDVYRQQSDSAGLMAIMIVILVVGIVVDVAAFGTLDRWVRRRHGLAGD